MARRSSVLFFALAAVLLLSTVVAAEECSGQGIVHGNHCHCNKGYKSKGLECVPVDGATASCPSGGISWEMSALVYLEKGTYTISLTKNDDNMAALLLPVENVTEASSEALEMSIEESLILLEDITLPRKLVKPNQVMAPSDNLLYIIQRNNAAELEKAKEECEAEGNTWHIDHCDGPEGHGDHGDHGDHRRLADEVMLVNLTITNPSFYALHLQHNAIEECGMQIISAQGSIVEFALVQAEEEEGEGASGGVRKATGAVWGKTLAAVTVVTLLSILGILLLALRPSVLQKLMDALIALSAGALFGAAFIHILPEAIEFYSEYGQMDLTLCMIFTTGFVVAMIVEMFLEVCVARVGGVGHGHGHNAPISARASAIKLLSPANAASGDVVEGFADTETPRTTMESSDPATKKKLLSVDWSTIKPMAYIIFFGDLFHNFVDGVLIATAFLACDDALGISVTVSAILHEVPQEFADFIILVDSGFTSTQALFFNFLSALSAYIGVIVILSSVEVTKETMGVLLGFGAGTLTYIAATDLLPRVLKVQTFGEFFTRLVLFGIGIGLLGLTTLHHVHCEV